MLTVAGHFEQKPGIASSEKTGIVSSKKNSPGMAIPVISYRDLINETNNACEQLGKALQEVGFFALVDHGIEHEQIKSAHQLIERLFALPIAVKQQHARPELYGQVGFSAFGSERAKTAVVPDLKEFWHIQRPENQRGSNELHKPANEWPASFGGFDGLRFQKEFCRLFKQLDQISVAILQACSTFIGEDKNFLGDCVAGGNSVLRLIHYPAIEHAVAPGSVRAAAHEDINFITLLLGATAPGLELLTKENRWLSVQAPLDSIIVDSADMLENLTNGRIRATTHRVVNVDENQTPRISMPFFVHPRSDVSLKPLNRSIAATGGIEKFRDISAGDFLQERLKEIAAGE